jgi:hypothetical protein
MEITTQQAEQLRRLHDDLGATLREAGVLDNGPTPLIQPQWLQATAKQWGLLKALATEHDGDVGSEEWARLGRQHGYDPRGLGGFFVGSQPLMASQGARRVLTGHGQRFIERWRADFAA